MQRLPLTQWWPGRPLQEWSRPVTPVWGGDIPPPPAPEAGFCNPHPSTAREEHAVDELQCHITRDTHAKGRMML